MDTTAALIVALILANAGLLAVTILLVLEVRRRSDALLTKTLRELNARNQWGDAGDHAALTVQPRVDPYDMTTV